MKILSVLCAFFLALTCEPHGSHGALKTNAPAEKPPTIDEATARDVLNEVNALRARGCRCPDGKYYAPASALRWDEQLEAAAQAHADDMSRRHYFDHTSLDGTSFSQRIRRAGYNWWVVGENIAEGYPTAHSVVEGWRNSEGHCANMMNAGFEDMGVGKTGPYWVQDFGARKK